MELLITIIGLMVSIIIALMVKKGSWFVVVELAGHINKG
jgi:hypothetical protein